MKIEDGSLDILAFPFHDARKAESQGIRWRDGHLLEHFSKHPAVRQLVIVDRPTSAVERFLTHLPPTVRGTPISRKRVGKAIGTLTRTRDKVAVLDMAVPDRLAPIVRGREWWFDVFHRQEVVDLVGWAVDELLPDPPSVIAWTPTVWPAIRAVRARRLVFDSLDNWISHPHLRTHAASAERAYEALLPRADAVIVSAPRSKSVLSRWSDDIEVIPNGVDPAAFQEPVERPTDLPDGPVVGYAGTLGPRIDVDLILEVADQLPEVSFVFIGPDPARRIVDRLASLRGTGKLAGRRLRRSRQNVHVLGDRHYRLVPSYVRHFDVAWIPHRVGEGESGGDPIKLYEYWAAGRPVVATKIDGLDRWREHLYLVEGGREAAVTIDGLLSGRIPRERVQVPVNRTWASIADRLVELLVGGRPAA